MTVQSLTLSKAKPEHKSMDYAFLREEGIRHIQELAGKVWTDYNTHDPGITLLEMLCYAVTDLGYRTQLDIKDLLASHPDGESNLPNFYTAAQIFPCNALTRLDFRKLIIDYRHLSKEYAYINDLKIIRNAWTEVADQNEIEFFAHEYLENDKKAFEYTYTEELNIETTVKGLYNIQLEFEEFKDGNNNTVDLNIHTVTDTLVTDGNTYELIVTFPFWDQLDDKWKKGLDINQILLDLNNEDFFKLLNTQQDESPSFYDYVTVLQLNNDPELTLELYVKVVAGKDIIINPQTHADLKSKLEELGENAIVKSHNNNKVKVINDAVAGLRTYLNQYRNLCEDFFEFKSVRIQEIVVDADIDTEADVASTALLGQIYYLIHNFISPAVKFRSLKEMFDLGRKSDEIFEGPVLNHGFIDSEEFEKISRKDIIYTSDLIRILMNTEGIVSVRNLTVSNYINYKNITKKAANCLNLASPDVYKPKFAPGKSEINFYKDTYKAAADQTTAIDTFNNAKEAEQPEKAQYDIEIPKGQDYDTENYYTIQNDFPNVYGIGENGLPLSASEADRGKAKQLKGYLLFFEQLLAGYFSQLAHVRDLFSIDPDIKKTYFYQNLYDVPNAAALFGPTFENDDAAWNLFKADEQNAYMAGLKKAFENAESDDPKDQYNDRRNRFLNHLIARFGESFTDYALYVIAKKENFENAPQQLIKDKTDFLSEYPVLGRDRARAFNHTAGEWDKNDPQTWIPDAWNTDNVSGYEKRIAKLLGIENYNRRFLFDQKGVDFYFTLYQENNQYGFELNAGNTVYKLKSSGVSKKGDNDQESQDNAYYDAAEATGPATQFHLYKIYEKGPNKWSFTLQNYNDITVAVYPDDAGFPSEAEAKAYVQGIIDFLTVAPGFHLIEHVLLRPKYNTEVKDENNVFQPLVDNFLPIFHVTKNGNKIIAESRDTYSFRFTIILPIQNTKFGDPDFRRLAEKIIRREAPAHTMPHIIWANVKEVDEIEPSFKDWLEKTSEPEPSLNKLNQFLLNLNEKQNLFREKLSDLLKTN